MSLSTDNFYVQDRSALKRYLAIVGFLGLVLLGMLFLYNLLNKPPEVKGDDNPKGLTSLFSIYGFEGDRLNRPTGVTTDANGNIYVADSEKHRILIFDSNGTFIDQFGDAGQKKYELWYPNAVAVADNGQVFVACKQSNRIVIFNADHKPIWQINVPAPLALTIKNNRVYSTTMRGVMIGDVKGNLINNFGTRGPRVGQVDFPTGIAVDDKGTIYVADSLNYRIQAFTPEGKSLWTFGKPIDKKNPLTDRFRTFDLPVSLTIDKDNILYVVDGLGGEITVLDTKGKQLDKVGDWGHNEGQFYYPEGIAYTGNETFVVADKFNDRVQVLRIPSPVITPIQRASGYGLPILALIPLLALILWMLRRRSFRYVFDESFIEEALSKGYAASIISELGKVYVTGSIYEKYKDVEENGVKLGALLKTRPFSPDVAKKITVEHGCTEEEAASISLSKELKGRIAMLTENGRVAQIAAAYGITAKRHDDLVDSQSMHTAHSPA